jgi:hypothetical protein
MFLVVCEGVKTETKDRIGAGAAMLVGALIFMSAGLISALVAYGVGLAVGITP